MCRWRDAILGAGQGGHYRSLHAYLIFLKVGEISHRQRQLGARWRFSSTVSALDVLHGELTPSGRPAQRSLSTHHYYKHRFSVSSSTCLPIISHLSCSRYYADLGATAACPHTLTFFAVARSPPRPQANPSLISTSPEATSRTDSPAHAACSPPAKLTKKNKRKRKLLRRTPRREKRSPDGPHASFLPPSGPEDPSLRGSTARMCRRRHAGVHAHAAPLCSWPRRVDHSYLCFFPEGGGPAGRCRRVFASAQLFSTENCVVRARMQKN